ncbi:MAG: lytic transglycosylase domain-containing protein [Magnetospirillum sp.]|nr:lytic transglycosylase domain-containing protein [Magnetospirillum sp.]
MKVSPAVVLIVAGLAAALPSVAAAERGGKGADRPYQQVFAAARRDHFDEAERLARGKPALLAKIVRWMDYTSARPTGSFAEIAAFIDANPDWPLLSVMQRRAEEAIAAATPGGEVLAWFQRHEPATVDGGMAYARALFAAGQDAKGVEVVRRTWVEGGFGALQEHQFLTRFGDRLLPEDHWRRLDRLLWDRQDGPAQRMLLRVGAGQRRLAQARLALQEDKANPEPALAAVPAELRDDPGLIYDRVRWLRHRDRDEAAIELLSHPSRNQVRPELWWQERSILARRALQKGLVSHAYQVAADNGLRSGTPQRAEADFLAGWIALRFLDDRDTAAQHFRQLWQGATTPLWRSRAAYWAGRAAEAEGDGKAAREWYTSGARYVTAYYGQLAASRLDGHHWPMPAEPKPAAEDIKRFDGRELTRAVRLLMAAGETDLLRPFFIRLDDTAQSAGERALVARLAEQGGRNDLGVVVARRADRDGVFLVKAGWPTPPIAADGGPEKALVLALIRQESGFHPSAVSPAGARGLMQLLPATAQRVARAIRVAFTPHKLDDPNYNVRIGSAYLDGLVSDFQGSYILALAAYNAGPSRARRWIHDLGDPRDPQVDVVDWIESIPFTETRNYVQRVMESVEIYRRRLGVPGGAGLEADLKRWARRNPG